MTPEEIAMVLERERTSSLERALERYPAIHAEWLAVRALEVEIHDAIVQAMLETVTFRARELAAFVARRFPELVERKLAIRPVVERIFMTDAGPGIFVRERSGP